MPNNVQHYQTIKDKLKNGDKITTIHKFIRIPREVTYENGGIIVNKYHFNWDFFFDVNEIIL